MRLNRLVRSEISGSYDPRELFEQKMDVFSDSMSLEGLAFWRFEWHHQILLRR